MEFSREEYWSGLPFASPGDLLHPGIKPPLSCIAGRFFTNWATRKSKEPEAAGENCCHLVEAFCNYNRTFGPGTSVSQAWGLSMTVVLRTWPGAWIERINSKHNQLSKYQQTSLYGKSRIQRMVCLIIKSSYFHYLLLRYLRDQNIWRWGKWLLISWLRIKMLQ